MKNSLRRLIIIAFLVGTSTAYGNPPAQIDATTLDYQNPFGFDWIKFDGDGKRIGDHWAECRELIERVSVLIGPEETEYFVKECAEESHSMIFIQRDQIPAYFRRGSISIVLRGDAEPVLYNYSFLHRVLGRVNPQNQIRRRKHASDLRNELNEIYGTPVATGHYDQSSRTGFVVDDDKKAPCQFWVKENVGILLCSERIILVDGIEMALSFMRLDRVPNGPLIRCMLDPESLNDCKDAAELITNKPSASTVRFLEVLAEWLDPDHFEDCKSDGLEPIEDVWTLSDSQKAEFASVLGKYSGDDLARFAIKYAEDPGSDLPPRTLDKHLMFLFRHAASQGSAIAMNEIGASLLYCLQHVQQDIGAARMWLEKAAGAGDKLAMRALARMHVLGMMDAAKPRQKAVEFLEQCTKIDEELCSDELTALKEFIAAQENLR